MICFYLRICHVKVCVTSTQDLVDGRHEGDAAGSLAHEEAVLSDQHVSDKPAILSLLIRRRSFFVFRRIVGSGYLTANLAPDLAPPQHDDRAHCERPKTKYNLGFRRPLLSQSSSLSRRHGTVGLHTGEWAQIHSQPTRPSNPCQTIAKDLNANSIQAYWTGTSFILASAVFQPVISALSVPFGRRPVIEVSLILFTIGTIVCATAQHVATILVGRTLQGVGGGGLLTMTYVVMADLLTLRERAKGFAVISVVWVSYLRLI